MGACGRNRLVRMTTLVTQRHYVRVSDQHEQTVTVNVDPDGYIRMTADNLHHVLLSLGFQPTEPKDHH